MTQKAKNRYDGAFACLLGGGAGATLELARIHAPIFYILCNCQT